MESSRLEGFFFFFANEFFFVVCCSSLLEADSYWSFFNCWARTCFSEISCCFSAIKWDLSSAIAWICWSFWSSSKRLLDIVSLSWETSACLSFPNWRSLSDSFSKVSTLCVFLNLKKIQMKIKHSDHAFIWHQNLFSVGFLNDLNSDSNLLIVAFWKGFVDFSVRHFLLWIFFYLFIYLFIYLAVLKVTFFFFFGSLYWIINYCWHLPLVAFGSGLCKSNDNNNNNNSNNSKVYLFLFSWPWFIYLWYFLFIHQVHQP